MFKRVAEFHRIFGQHIASVPGFPEQHIRDLRIRLLREELDEFCKAYQEDDLVEMADGLADMCYVIAGTCVSYGIAPEDSYESPFQDVVGKMDLFVCIHLDHLMTEMMERYEQAEQSNDIEEVSKVAYAFHDAHFWRFIAFEYPYQHSVHGGSSLQYEQVGYRREAEIPRGR